MIMADTWEASGLEEGIKASPPHDGQESRGNAEHERLLLFGADRSLVQELADMLGLVDFDSLPLQADSKCRDEAVYFEHGGREW